MIGCLRHGTMTHQKIRRWKMKKYKFGVTKEMADWAIDRG